MSRELSHGCSFHLADDGNRGAVELHLVALAHVLVVFVAERSDAENHLLAACPCRVVSYTCARYIEGRGRGGGGKRKEGWIYFSGAVLSEHSTTNISCIIYWCCWGINRLP